MASKLGVSKQSLGRYERGDREAPASVITSFAKLGVSPLWIVTGDGEMLLASKDRPDDDYIENQRWLRAEVEKMGYVHVPLFDVEAAAGSGALVVDEEKASPIAFNRAWLHRQLGANPADLVAIPARGDSMCAGIGDGDLLLVDRAEPKLRPGNGIYVFRFGDGLFVKRLQRRLDGGLLVTSDNGDVYPAEIIPADRVGEVEIVGRVVWNVGQLSR